jgi:hypothetical protein
VDVAPSRATVSTVHEVWLGSEERVDPPVGGTEQTTLPDVEAPPADPTLGQTRTSRYQSVGL